MSQIQPVSQTIDQLFRTYEQIKIPLNQRGFEWGREQASDFWNDVFDAYTDEKKIFLGTVVLYSIVLNIFVIIICIVVIVSS